MPKPPVLAGQHVDYLEQALTSYRNGRRKNVVMDGMAQLLTSDEDVKNRRRLFRESALAAGDSDAPKASSGEPKRAAIGVSCAASSGTARRSHSTHRGSAFLR